MKMVNFPKNITDHCYMFIKSLTVALAFPQLPPYNPAHVQVSC